LSNHQNNYERSNVDDNATKSFNILASSLNVLYNYFDGQNKIIFKFVPRILQRNCSFRVYMIHDKLYKCT